MITQAKDSTMDIWKYYDVIHREHVLCNPTNEEKLQRLIDLLRLPSGARVVDIASGKGEFLIRLAEAYDIVGTGVDISPFFTADAERRLQARAPGTGLTFREMNGAEFKPDTPNSLALASCIGASWIYGGHEGTLDALIEMVEPGGWIVVGEPYWRCEPSEEYLLASGDKRDSFASHAENAEAGLKRGLELVSTFVSSQDDWDQYEGLQWYSTADYARSHPNDPDMPEIVGPVAKNREVYLKWGRDTVGWAIYAFRRRP